MGCFIKTARLLSSCGTEHNREFLPLRQSEKTALCIRCTPEEANVIRMAAKNEHRTVGGCRQRGAGIYRAAKTDRAKGKWSASTTTSRMSSPHAMRDCNCAGFLL